MSVAELLAILNPKINEFDRIPGGGKPSLTDHDVAAAIGLCSIPKGAKLLARVKWARQNEFIRELSVSLYTRVMDEFGHEWTYLQSHRPGLVLDICKLASAEYSKANTCPECLGRKEATINSKVIVCGACHGAGVVSKETSKRSRADALGVSWGTYQRVWDDKYNQVLDILAHWDSLALGAIRKRLFGD